MGSHCGYPFQTINFMKFQKNILVKILIITTIILFIIYNMGIQIGNVRIGKQVDLLVKQDYEYENSLFYKNYYSKKNLIVLNTWATWCKPCLEEIPELNAIKESYKNDSIYFLSLSVDEDSQKLKKYLDKGSLMFYDFTLEDLKYRTAILNLIEGRPVEKHILTYSVPKTFIIKNQKVLFVIDGQIDDTELRYQINKNK